MVFLKSHAAKKRGICLLLSLCFAGFMLPAESRNVSFKLPSSDKLSDGDTPQTADKAPASLLKLSPVGLHDEEAQAGNDDPSMLKSTVSQNDFRSKTQAGSGEKNAVATGEATSVVDKKKLGDKLKKGKQAPDVGPIALHETEEEAQAKVDTVVDAERRQMSQLWQCTIDRNPDIQYVIHQLQPTTDAGHAMASTMKFLTATLCGAMNMAPFMLPGGAAGQNAGAMLGMGSGSSLIQSLFQDKAEKSAKKQSVSQQEATILYTIVRNTADKLVASYRDYKKEQSAITRATTDLNDLKSMVAEARQGQSPSTQIEMEYTLRKAKRDIDEKLEQARLYRQQLTDLAGGDAIAKLDKEMLDESSAVEMLTGTGSKDSTKVAGPFVNPLSPPQVAAPAAVETGSTIAEQVAEPAKKIASAKSKHKDKHNKSAVQETASRTDSVTQ